ncbi:hypothetical protein [Lactobacillus sp. Sy-1]|nr:hypothetical protein [Lactobacillus sp. Sy-1]MBW1606210.1 hypothetical protein [Lactobacillus sp. Sy-1]
MKNQFLFLFRQRLIGYTLDNRTLILITGTIVIISVVVVLLIIKFNRK